MGVKKIITVPHPTLRKKSKPVKKFDAKLKTLASDLTKTAESAKEPEGVGLSAVQINLLKRIFVVKLNDQFEIFVNPRMTKSSKKTFRQLLEQDKLFLEGCLSIPGYFALVDRPFEVEFTWRDLKGKKQTRTFKNKFSAYVQHELDHLNGILFTDRALKQGQTIYKLEKNKEGKEKLTPVDF